MPRSRASYVRFHHLVLPWPSTLILLMLGGVAAAQQPKASSGLVIAQAGEVWVTRPGTRLALTEGFVLQAGDTVWARMGGSCRGFTTEGESFSLTGPGQLVLASTAPRKDRGGVSGWIARLVAEWTGGIQNRTLTTRAARSWEMERDACSSISPAPEGRVRAGGTIFRWTSIPGVDRYAITIAPATGTEEKHIVRGHSLAVNDLAPGADYVWRVNPVVEGPEMQPGRWNAFRVLSKDEESSLAKAIEDRSDLEAGVLLLSAGLHEEAVNRLDIAINSAIDRRSALRWRAAALSAMGQHAAAYSDLLETMAGP